MKSAIFNRDGTLSRKRNTPCKQCGAYEDCDICWEHASDWSPFGVKHCFVCLMPQAVYDPRGSGWHLLRCDFCGADEAEFTTTTGPSD
jgi:hypothetical protein